MNQQVTPLGEQESFAEPQYMNDAVLLGQDHPDMQALLKTPFRFMTGNLYGVKDLRNTQDGDWQNQEMPLLALLIGAEKGDAVGNVIQSQTWGLTRHPVMRSKEGASIVFASGIEGSRKDAAIESMSAIGLDIDSGAALDDVIAKLEEQNLFAIVYTSYSHGKAQLVLKHDDIMRKLKLDASPSIKHVQEYLRDHHKDRYDESFIAAIEIEDARQQTKDGLRVVLKTPPLDKFRVVLPLWEPVQLSDLAPTLAGWKKVWEDAVTGVAMNTLGGVSFDATSCDVNRLFYTPRHRDGAEWDCAIVQGRPLRFEEIAPHSKAEYVHNRGGAVDPFATGTTDTGQRERFETADGLDLNNWHRKYKDRWLVADVLETFCPDKIRVAGGEKVGTVHLECPLEHEHSSEGGTATMAMNPDATDAGFWTIFCQHDACKGRNKLEYLKEMLDQGWIDESVLTDPDWCLGEADQDMTPDQSTISDDDYTPPEPLSAPLFDPDLAIDGVCKRKDAGEVRSQIKTNLRKRVSHVIDAGGKSKIYVTPARGRMPEIWDDTALSKYYRNKSVRYKAKGADKYTVIKPADVFWDDPDRVTYQGTQFEPDPAKVDDSKFNTFNGFPIQPRSGDWDLLRDHLRDNLCAGNGSEEISDKYLFNYVMTWCADIFQNPGRKLGSSIAIMGEQGTGKSKFFEWFSESLGDYSVKVASKKHLVGNFDSHLDSKLLVVGEEAFWSGDKEAAGILKDFITSDRKMTERKGVDAVERANYTRTGFVTNNDWAVPTDDNADARRFLVLRASNAQKQNGKYFAAIDEQMRNGGLEAMVHEFMTWDPTKHGLTWDSLRQAPWTPARAEQATQGASFAMTALLQAIDDGLFTDRDGTDVYLSDTKTTRVNRTDLVAFMQGSKTHGGARSACTKAVKQLLGDDAWHGNKHTFENGKRDRYVAIPPLNDLRERIKDTFQ